MDRQISLLRIFLHFLSAVFTVPEDFHDMSHDHEVLIHRMQMFVLAERAAFELRSAFAIHADRVVMVPRFRKIAFSLRVLA